MAEPIKKRLSKLRPGDEVVLVEISGARFQGTVVGSRVGIDPDESIGLRRSTGTVHWVPVGRIRDME